MSELDQIVSVSITADTRTPTRKGFGTPLLAAYFPVTVFPERVKTFASSAEMITEGFGVNHPAVRGAQHIEAQDPHPKTFKIGRCALAPTHTVNLIPTINLEGTIIGVDIISPAGVKTEVRHTVTAGQTIAQIVTALHALIGAPIAGLGSTDQTTHVAVTADAAGEYWGFQNFLGGLRCNDVTPDPGIATDLAAIEAEDDDWYGLAIDGSSEPVNTAAAAWIATRKKIFLAQTADKLVLDGTAGNLGEDLMATSNARVGTIFNQEVLSFAGAAWLGVSLPRDPGSITLAFKELKQIVPDKLSTTQRQNLDTDRVNHYMTIAGINATRNGVAASGAFLDVTITIDAITARIQEEVWRVIANLGKLSYTDASVSLIKSTIRGVLRTFQQTGALDPETEPLVEAPLVKDVPIADRANRHLPDVKFQARLGGAIHSVTVVGTLSV